MDILIIFFKIEIIEYAMEWIDDTSGVEFSDLFVRNVSHLREYHKQVLHRTPSLREIPKEHFRLRIFRESEIKIATSQQSRSTELTSTTGRICNNFESL
ncbi:hypothetical protein GCK72_013246 [Caenorhabditis remanei]|uniref:Uncharacterized protein n=1 Tax=Caenorhabditis remanei TaxID=31234 RepID=A0A6A5GQY9_CAERE|nr:hypothetical protein GCK72_013246 [Caenorhabditis remanei]KAF1756792.1 hypothetical protein GCK72_013246 [Caenorhabditis remanei]